MESETDPVVEYKTILSQVLENRPSGTRSRLAAALGKNRSFVTQITSPAYAVPIPAGHIDTILEICHFAPELRQRFLDAYERAHPGRLGPRRDLKRLRAHTVYLPDLGNPRANLELDQLFAELARRVQRLFGETRDEGRGTSDVGVPSDKATSEGHPP